MVLNLIDLLFIRENPCIFEGYSNESI